MLSTIPAEIYFAIVSELQVPDLLHMCILNRAYHKATHKVLIKKGAEDYDRKNGYGPKILFFAIEHNNAELAARVMSEDVVSCEFSIKDREYVLPWPTWGQNPRCTRSSIASSQSNAQPYPIVANDGIMFIGQRPAKPYDSSHPPSSLYPRQPFSYGYLQPPSWYDGPVMGGGRLRRTSKRSPAWRVCMDFMAWDVLEVFFAAGFDVNGIFLDPENPHGMEHWLKHQEMCRLVAIYGDIELYKDDLQKEYNDMASLTGDYSCRSKWLQFDYPTLAGKFAKIFGLKLKLPGFNGWALGPGGCAS